MNVSKTDNNINFKGVKIKVHYRDFRKGTNAIETDVIEEIKSATKRIEKRYARTNLKFDIRKGIEPMNDFDKPTEYIGIYVRNQIKGFNLKKIIKALFIDGFSCAKTSKAEDIVSGADEAVKDLISEEKIYKMPPTKLRFLQKKEIPSKFLQFDIKNCKN